MSRDSGSLFSKLVQACVSLMVAAIAFSVAVTVIRPYLPGLAVAAVVVAVLWLWRAWQRSRW